MDFDLTPDQQALVRMVAGFARDHVAPAQAEMERDNRFPIKAWAAWSDLGMAGAMIPEAHGGSGLDSLSYLLCVEELAATSQTFTQIWQIHSLVSLLIADLGTPEQQAALLPDLAAGRKTPAFALTEPGAGSDAAAIRTRADRQPDGGWRLNGTKTFITNTGSDISDGTVVFAVTGQRPGGRPAITAFHVPRDTPGFSWGPPLPKMAWHGLHTRELALADVRLRADQQLGPEGGAFSAALRSLTLGRIGLAALACGLARACRDLSLDYALQRQQFGKPIAAFQLTQAKLADMAAHHDAMCHMTHHAAWLHATGRECQAAASMAKLVTSRLAASIARDAMLIHGGSGYMTDTPANRLFREAQVLEIGEGTTEIQQIILARHMGCPA
ncbi:acyl-CoA dehydrogenase family protein [Gemmobacter sp.]|uniref:acyl-CoA dehydrogenase family protein n=1 Tax=Gemmobacter sp. TaxID=1898957 RepID=UPI002AFF5608|nr:acyl-CoA dehydrogenase family protein [Gemmobacter sp.]